MCPDCILLLRYKQIQKKKNPTLFSNTKLTQKGFNISSASDNFSLNFLYYANLLEYI